jgi:hypothetical protein
VCMYVRHDLDVCVKREKSTEQRDAVPHGTHITVHIWFRCVALCVFRVLFTS